MKNNYTLNFIKLILGLLIISFQNLYSQENNQDDKPTKFHYIEVESHFGAFLKSDNILTEAGAFENGYGVLTIKYAWQPTDPEGWASGYSYPSYGAGFYVGYFK